jgi:hypothetical protein
LVVAGLEKLKSDIQRYQGQLPSNYYEEFSRHIYAKAFELSRGDYGAAFSLLEQFSSGDFGPQAARAYTVAVGEQTSTTWDKVRHFATVAELQWMSEGILAPEIGSYGKEVVDELMSWVGLHPTGWDPADIEADIRGEAFAEEMRGQAHGTLEDIYEEAEIELQGPQELWELQRALEGR